MSIFLSLLKLLRLLRLLRLWLNLLRIWLYFFFHAWFLDLSLLRPERLMSLFVLKYGLRFWNHTHSDFLACQLTVLSHSDLLSVKPEL